MYDYLVVGTGLFGAVFTHEAISQGKTVLMIDKRNHIGGNVYTENINGINVHRYGAHIFHTNDKMVWDYLSRFCTFNRFTNSPVANYKGELYSLPFNMYTFNKMWGVISPDEALLKIEEQKKELYNKKPENLEEQAISLVGRDIYEKLIKGYTEKQWGRQCIELPPFIINRLPVRFTFDNNYFNAKYQGIPEGGYTALINKLIEGADILLDTDFVKNRDKLKKVAKRIVYTGPIDEYYDYKFGSLEYRTVSFEMETLTTDNYQGNAVVNYTDTEVPWTRIIEHKWFEFGKDINGNEIKGTIISKEYSTKWKEGMEPYYPINDKINNEKFLEYEKLSKKESNVIFGGRLGTYRYLDMDQIVMQGLSLAKKELTE